MTPTATEIDPRQQLKVIRIIWAALVMGVVGVAAAFGVLINGRTPPDDMDPTAISMMFYAAIGLAALNIPLGLFLRGQVMKRGWVGDVVKPLAYQTGNIVAWAMFEGVAFFSLIICLLAGTFWPYILPGAAAWLVMLLTWPNGRAMFPPRDPYAVNTGER